MFPTGMHFGGVSNKRPLRHYLSSANCHFQLLYLTLRKLLLGVKLIWELTPLCSLLTASWEQSRSQPTESPQPPALHIKAHPSPRLGLGLACVCPLKLKLYAVCTIFSRDKLRRGWTGCCEFLNFLRWAPPFPASISARHMWGS